jgi:hypothetical protein
MQANLSRDAAHELRRQLTAFLLTTFVLSWGIFAGAMLLDLAESPLVILGVWGPSV